MGGLAVDVSDIDDRLRSVTLTPAGLKLLAERGHFIEVSDGDIRDKSKADIFAKCLVILQVAWIALQTISRKASGYPLSPLEIHTLVHAACASVMYILWFRKPLDVQAPIILSKAGFEDLTALMLTQIPRSDTTWYSHLDPHKGFEKVWPAKRAEASFLMFDDSALSRRDEGCSSCGEHLTSSITREVEVADKGVLHTIPKSCDSCINLSRPENQQVRIFERCTLSSPITSHPPAGIRCGPPPGVEVVCELRSGDFTPDGIGLQPWITMHSHHVEIDPKEGCCGLWKFLNPRPPQPTLPAQISPALKERLPLPTEGFDSLLREQGYCHEINLSLSEKDFKRWKLAGAAYLKEMKIQEAPDPGNDPGNGRYRHFEIDQSHIWSSRFDRVLAWRCRNVRWGSSGNSLVTLTSTLSLLGSLYGGIHLALWNYDFPTSRETFLWRFSAATLASASVIFLLVALLTFAYDGYEKYSERREERAQKSYRNDAFQRAPPSSSSTNWLRKTLRGFCSGVRSIWIRDMFWIREMFRRVVILIFALAVVAAVLLYIFARIFIVVESFISLRHVPIGVYEGGLGWSKYIPHL